MLRHPFDIVANELERLLAQHRVIIQLGEHERLHHIITVQILDQKLPHLELQALNIILLGRNEQIDRNRTQILIGQIGRIEVLEHRFDHLGLTVLNNHSIGDVLLEAVVEHRLKNGRSRSQNALMRPKFVNFARNRTTRPTQIVTFQHRILVTRRQMHSLRSRIRLILERLAPIRRAAYFTNGILSGDTQIGLRRLAFHHQQTVIKQRIRHRSRTGSRRATATPTSRRLRRLAKASRVLKSGSIALRTDDIGRALGGSGLVIVVVLGEILAEYFAVVQIVVELFNVLVLVLVEAHFDANAERAVAQELALLKEDRILVDELFEAPVVAFVEFVHRVLHVDVFVVVVDDGEHHLYLHRLVGQILEKDAEEVLAVGAGAIRVEYQAPIRVLRAWWAFGGRLVALELEYGTLDEALLALVALDDLFDVVDAVDVGKPVFHAEQRVGACGQRWHRFCCRLGAGGARCCRAEGAAR